MLQLILHLIGDYILQSDWMANNKTSQNIACVAHALVYTLPFILVTQSKLALLVIMWSHFLIDRFRLAKYVCYYKNFLAPECEVWQCDARYLSFEDEDLLKEKYRWENCKATGYPSETPQFLAVWLMIITDNTLHLTINYFAINYL